MSNVFDVGQLITELVPNVDKMKLYKLCFFLKVGILPGLVNLYSTRNLSLGQRDQCRWTFGKILRM